MTDYRLDETCRVCGRVRYGEYQYLGLGHWRHADCCPGSPDWIEHYPSMSASTKTADTEALYQYKVSLLVGEGSTT